jgi:hypothetical protein
MWYFVIYILGIILSIFFLKKFGKRIGFDYTPNKDSYWDDWQSNTEAYLAFSIVWPLFFAVLAFWGTWSLLFKFTDWVLNNGSKEEVL